VGKGRIWGELEGREKRLPSLEECARLDLDSFGQEKNNYVIGTIAERLLVGLRLAYVVMDMGDWWDILDPKKITEGCHI